MGKKQHSQDRMFLTATEWKQLGGFKGPGTGAEAARLPLDCCALTFQPFEHPVCSPEGHIFELEAIVPYVQKYHKNPVTDAPLELSQLIKLKFSRNAEGDLQCASSQETFSANTHVVALKTTGNVYSWDAIETLCIKPKTLQDLIDDSPFTKADIITLQDPHNFSNRVASNFAHIANENVAKQVESMKKGGGAASSSSAPSPASSSSSSSTPASKSATGTPAPRGRPNLGLGISLAPKPSGAAAAAASLTGTVGPGPARGLYSSGQVSGSLTSTSMSVSTNNERQVLSAEAILEQHYTHLRKTKAKGYVRLSTTLGQINLELHVDMVPRTCHNFLELCERNYYKDTIIHRVIPGFMCQMGDPTGTGRGGEGAFEREFKDEFHSNLKHDSRGVVAMANSGPNTNASQFYILFGAAAHLDQKHSVFGRVVGGMETLDAIEAVETVKSRNEQRPKDAPKKDILITATTVYTNPFKEAFVPKDLLTGKQADAAPEKEVEDERGAWFSNVTAQALPQQGGDEKFKYLNLPKPSQVDASGVAITTAARKGKRKESPNDEGADEVAASAHPAVRAAASSSTTVASPIVPMDTSITPRANEIDPDALAFEQARKRQQIAAAQQAKPSGYGNFGNW